MLPLFSNLIVRKAVMPVLVILGLTIFSAPVYADQAPANSASALTNWQSALSRFRQAGASIGDGKLDRARTELDAAATNLAPPYSAMAGQFATRLGTVAALSPDAKNPVRQKGLIKLCAELRAYDVALKLQTAASSAEDLADDPTYAWRLFETGNFQAALTEYKRRLADEAVPNLADYDRDQIRLLEQRAANRTNVQFSLELVRLHYLKGYEETADSLCALEELYRIMPHARTPTQTVAVVEAIIGRLGDLGDEPGREAWEDKLLGDFKAEAEPCANVLLERGLRAFGNKDYPKTLALLRQVCSNYADSAAWGDAQFTVALALQQQGKFDEAIAEFRKIFPSKVRDHDLDPEKSDDCKNYRHRSALHIAECYASKKDFAQAISFVEQARDQYTYVSYCKNCLQENKEFLARRISELQDALSKQPTATTGK